MPTEYPVLDGRPIDRWRVTELKEELKRRKLITRGLKDELIKRLDEAIRQDEESLEEEDTVSDAKSADNTTQLDGNKTSELTDTLELDHNNTEVDDNLPIGATGEDKVVKLQYPEITQNTMQHDESKAFKVDDSAPIGVIEVENPKVDQMTKDTKQFDENRSSKVDEKDSVEIGQVNVEKGDLVFNDDIRMGIEGLAEGVSLETDTVSRVMVTTMALNETINVENEDSKPSHIDAALDISNSTKQVNEGSHDLEPQVKCESFSNKSVSILKNYELESNLNANNINLELDVVKPVDETEDNKSIHGDFSKRDHNADGESLKNPQLYKTDDLVEEDLMETKEINSNYNSNEADNMSEFTVLNNECLVGKVGPELPQENVKINSENESTTAASIEGKPSLDGQEPIDVDSSKISDNKDGVFMEKLNLDHFPDDDFMEEEALETKQVSLNDNNKAGNKISSDKMDNDATPSDKRKLQDGVIDEPPKRQRKWNSENLKVQKPQSIKPCTSTPKDSDGTFSRSDSVVSLDLPKERVVPASPKPPTSSLRIDRFLRPFTLKAVQELLAKTGNVCNFWMDNIKTHCYVTYSTVEEATETRNSVYNLQWPPNGGRLLVAEFVDPQEVKMRVEAPATPITPSPQPTQSSRQQGARNLPALPPPPPLLDPPARREPPPKALEPPIVTLDDLFRKTRATPRIYYLPLAEQQVAAKLGNK